LPEKLMNFMKRFVEGSIMIAMIYAIQGNPWSQKENTTDSIEALIVEATRCSTLPHFIPQRIHQFAKTPDSRLHMIVSRELCFLSRCKTIEVIALWKLASKGTANQWSGRFWA
jgi:hypothetical protein